MYSEEFNQSGSLILLGKSLWNQTDAYIIGGAIIYRTGAEGGELDKFGIKNRSVTSGFRLVNMGITIV